MSYKVLILPSLAAAAGLAFVGSGYAFARASGPPDEIAGTITWSLTREAEDPERPGRRESATTTVTMDVVLRVARSRAGVTLFQVREGTWTAVGTGSVEDRSAGCRLTRDTDVDLRGTFQAANNVVTLLQSHAADRALLNFSLGEGDGSVIARSRYCDGVEVSQNQTYFWAISDATVDVIVRRGARGSLEFVVAKEETVPCGAGATCARTASGVLAGLAQ